MKPLLMSILNNARNRVNRREWFQDVREAWRRIRPTLKEDPAGPSERAEVWEERAEVAVATFIRRHLAEDPPPYVCAVARDLVCYAEALARDGQARLEEEGARRLRVLDSRR